ncbi:hypothetical protein COV18_01540 [Candidatus Woesearchaeota archaeon CG10_big_fil_rev_8_21_14_0_10_37_12]|nr:MAG: hypothetical protein COV18_01540 [Candidatus Woesearchaeota archaeon CG10_big_fil_rev_8_21_14_0_10_37_12]
MRQQKIGCLFVLLLIVACSGQTEREQIELGSILILTGDGSSWGTDEKNGIDLAISELNADGGVLGKQIVVNHQDDHSSEKGALTAFQMLTEVENIDIIIGTTWSFTGLPLVNLADEKKALMISPSLGVKEFNEGSHYLFNTWPHDYILSTYLADYVYDQGHRTIAVVNAQEVWVQAQTDAFVKRFEDLGGTIKLTIDLQVDDTNVRSDALKIKNADVDAVVLTAAAIQVGSLFGQSMEELGISLPMYSITLDRDIIASANGAYDGMQFLTFLTPTDEFADKYKRRHGKEPDIGADSAYDAVMLIAKAMQATKSTDTTVLADYLNQLKKYEGASGHLIADGKGGFTKEYLVKEIRNGLPITI